MQFPIAESAFCSQSLFKEYACPHLDINKRSKNDVTPLHIAAEYGALELMEFLVDQGADTTALTIHRDTILFAAYRSKSVSKIKCAIEHAADIRNRTIDGETVVDLALDDKDYSALTCLLLAPDMDTRNLSGEVKFLDFCIQMLSRTRTLPESRIYIKHL